MPRLTELAIHYNSDKWHRHSYIPFYERLFYGMQPKTVLEIGIGYEGMMAQYVPKYTHASSLLMWEEFWPDAIIYGCDIRPDTMIQGLRIKTTICDQSKPTQLLSLIGWCGRPDIIIDDGSHQLEHQIITAMTLGPYLRKGGCYVVEDVQFPEELQSEIGGEIHRFDKCNDDCLVVLKK